MFFGTIHISSLTSCYENVVIVITREIFNDFEDILGIKAHSWQIYPLGHYVSVTVLPSNNGDTTLADPESLLSLRGLLKKSGLAIVLVQKFNI